MTQLPTRYKPLIAVVEDDAAVREIAAQMLEHGGFDVLQARDGQEALELIAVVHEELALVLSDVNMPRVDGVTLATHVASLYPNLPMLLMSACPHEARQRVLKARLDLPVMDKPFQMKTLLAAVRLTLRPLATVTAECSRSAA